MAAILPWPECAGLKQGRLHGVLVDIPWTVTMQHIRQKLLSNSNLAKSRSSITPVSVYLIVLQFCRARQFHCGALCKITKQLDNWEPGDGQTRFLARFRFSRTDILCCTIPLVWTVNIYCPACRTTLVATRFRVAVICPIIQVPHCIRVFFHFVWFVFINHILQFYYVPIVTFWIFTYHKILILSIMFCFIWSYWIIYFLACLEVSWRVVS